MKLVLTIFWIFLGFLVLWVFSLNVGQNVKIDLFFTEYENVNLITVTFTSLFIGFLFGLVFFLIQLAKAKKEKFQLKKQIKAMQAEIQRLSEVRKIGTAEEDIVDADIVDEEEDMYHDDNDNEKN